MQPNDPPLLVASTDQLGHAVTRAEFEAWFSDGGQNLRAVERRGDSYKLAQTHHAWWAWQAGADAMRERLRGHFRDALADHGISWPGEVDILYDKCFGAQYSPDEVA